MNKFNFSPKMEMLINDEARKIVFTVIDKLQAYCDQRAIEVADRANREVNAKLYKDDLPDVSQALYEEVMKELRLLGIFEK